MQEERNHKEQNEWELVLSIKDIIFSLNEGNNTQSVNIIIDKFDKVHPFSFNLIIIQMIYDTFALRMDNPLIYLKFMKEIQEKSKINIIDEFTSYLLNKRTHESNYLIDTMIEQKILEPKIVSNISDPYFTHYKEETKQSELSVNDQELHKELLKEGHNPNEITKIIRNDDIEKLQEISSQTNFNFNQTIEPSLYERCSFINKPNISLIDYAAFFGSIKCFKFLLINGTDVSNASKYAVAGGNEEIIHICEQNHLSFYKGQETAIKFHQNDIFLYLYENKIKQINNFEELGKKCISHNNYEIFSFLQEKGMTINDEIINKTALIGNFYLVRYFLNEKQPPKDILSFSVRSNNLELIKYILEQKDININERSKGQTALMLASSNNKIEIVKLLLEQKEIDINAKNRNGHTALMDASYDGHAEIVKLLLEQEGIDINVKGGDGKTALILASSHNKKEIVELLLEQNGIDVNAKDKWGNTALMWASLQNYLEIVQLLLSHEGIDINAENDWGNTALLNASKRHTEIVKLLLEQKEINVNAKNKDGKTGLIEASENGHTEIVKLLLEQKGIDINAKDNWGNTALMFASSNNYVYIVKLLLEQKGIDINAQNNEGSTAFMLASSKGYTNIAELLTTQNGLDIDTKDKYCLVS